jgi:tRNA nucleotidyltransferase/poly(A) polymerase
MAPDRSWQVDLTPLRGASLEEDLSLRDFTVNAIAEPLAGGAPVDPSGGIADAEQRVLRMVSPRAFADDPLRVVRLARFAVTHGLEADPASEREARRHAAGLERVAGERIYAELRKLLASDAAPTGIELLRRSGALAVVLPEIEALSGIEQTVYHHKDAYGHTLEVVERAAELERDPAALFGPELGARVAALLAEPLGDELTRAGGLRFGALLHDAAKPPTQTPSPKGGFGFPGHDSIGADMARDALGRLRASERVRAYVAALTRHHLRPGFLVHQAPLDRREVFAYLQASAPYEVDVILISVADRLATRGRKSDEAIAKHLDVAHDLLEAALDWRDQGPPEPLVRGDELARELGLRPGPEVGRLLRLIAEAQYVGAAQTRADALALARSALAA